jgi:hypothetical protein
MAEAVKCPRCGGRLSGLGPGGHCPACLLQLGLAGRDYESSASSALPFLGEPGDRIGRYKLLQEIGEGGAGVVYLAEQEQPVRRRVALKIIKLGMDTRQMVARFEAERQALALMDHPYIAKVFDAGATESGRPYFVMELVSGVKITDYCDQHRCSTRQRLELFTQVCQAVQHAHQKGIIHRDLKPSNVLVTELDGVALPKIIDFGIARSATGQRLTDKTVFTAFAQFLGTPAYMSPEQMGLGELDIDPRSDIYSLGVLLYELLVGRPPFDRETLAQTTLDEVCRRIRETEAPRPSTRLAAFAKEDRQAVAEGRQPEPDKLLRLIRGDLDCIVMNALEKDRERRYKTANELAADVKRHLDNKPIVARRPGAGYVFQKLVRRNQLAFVGAAAAILALALGGSAWLYQKARPQRAEGATVRAGAVRLEQAEQAQRTVAQAETLYRNGQLGEAEGLLNALPPSSLEPNSTHAMLRRKLGERHAWQNQWKESAANLIALVRVDKLDESDLREIDYQNCAGALLEARETNRYEALRQMAVTQFIETASPVTAARIARLSLLLPADPELMASLDIFYQKTARFQSERVATGDRGEAWACVSLALVDYRRGNYSKAIQWCRRALAYPRGDPIWAPGVSLAQVLLAMSDHQLHRTDEAPFALAYTRDPVERAFQGEANSFKSTAATPAVTVFDWVDARILLREAAALLDREKPPAGVSPSQARIEFEKMVVLREEQKFEECENLLRATPPPLFFLEAYETGRTLHRLGWWHVRSRQWPQAEASWRAVAFGPDDAGSLLAGRDLTYFYLAYAPLLVEMGRSDTYAKLRAAMLSTFGDTGDFTEAFWALTVCLLQPPEPGSARQLEHLAEVVERRDAWQTNQATWPDASLACFYCRRGDFAQAMRWLHKDGSFSNSVPGLIARFHVLTALTCCQLHQYDQARSELALCEEAIQQKFNGPILIDEGMDPTGAWHDWLIDYVFLAEVKRLLDGAPFPNPGGPK